MCGKRQEVDPPANMGPSSRTKKTTTKLSGASPMDENSHFNDVASTFQTPCLPKPQHIPAASEHPREGAMRIQLPNIQRTSNGSIRSRLFYPGKSPPLLTHPRSARLCPTLPARLIAGQWKIPGCLIHAHCVVHQSGRTVIAVSP